jgi:hypothetical protein
VLCSLSDRRAALAEVARVLLTGGCHTATDPVGLIEAAGFAVTAVRRLRFPESRLTQPAAPHVLGLARRPS